MALGSRRRGVRTVRIVATFSDGAQYTRVEDDDEGSYELGTWEAPFSNSQAYGMAEALYQSDLGSLLTLAHGEILFIKVEQGLSRSVD